MSSQDDTVQRFLFDKLAMRGAIVHLDESYQTIMRQHAYPKSVAKLLGEALLSAVLLCNTIKFEGQLTIQFQSDGLISLLVAKCNHKGLIRAMSQWDHAALSDELEYALGDGQLVITIERDDAVKPYQSIVPFNRKSIAGALENYFEQSEQLPTQFVFAVDKGRAAGMMLQRMPDENFEQDNWDKAAMIMQTVTTEELFGLENEKLIHRLYHEEDIRLFDVSPVEFYCNCSVERMANAIRACGKDEIEQILAEKQEVAVCCEYCNHEYKFSKDDIHGILNPTASS